MERYFTPDFELDDPSWGARRSGLEGARAMCDALRAVGENVQLEILHIIEQGDLLGNAKKTPARSSRSRASVFSTLAH